jgi:hypothetical protein
MLQRVGGMSVPTYLGQRIEWLFKIWLVFDIIIKTTTQDNVWDIV